MATKVGEGYIEIKPRLVGFSRELLRTARRHIRDMEEASREAFSSISVRPKITGITKAWQREVQQELNAKITGLTVDVKVKLQNDALKATFNDFTVEAKRAGEKGGEDLSKGFKQFIGGVHREINEVNIALKTGLKVPWDSDLKRTVDNMGKGFRLLAKDIGDFDRQQVRAINQAVNSFKTLHNMMDRETKKASTEYERAIHDVIKATDRMSDRIKARSTKPDTAGVWNLVKELDDEIGRATKLFDNAFPDLEERVKSQGEKVGKAFSGAFGRALKSNFFDNVTDSILSFGFQLGVAAVSAQFLISILSNLAAGAINLGTIVVDLYGAFLALPAVWSAVAQAGVVLTAAFWGVGEALTALENEEQHSAANQATRARQITAAQEQIADAKERLARVVEAANESVERAEEALANAHESAARRIQDAQERVSQAHAQAAEAVARANARIEDAQKAVSRAYETAADRIAAAEARHVDSIKRVEKAQQDLNQAYADALERFEDLNIALGNAILDEEGARLAIERAKERLDATLADPNASDLDKREADLAYRQALQRLAAVQERQNDLREEVAEANREGVEGSREVVSARERLIEAQQAEIQAQRDIAKAHKDAAEQIQAAQERLAEAQADAVKAQVDGAARVREAEEAVAKARVDGAKGIERAQQGIADAHKSSARSIADAQKAVQRAMDNLTETQERQTEQWFNARYAMEQLSPEAQKFVQYLHDVFLPKMELVQWSIQDAFFPPIRDALGKTDPLIDLMMVKLNKTGQIFGEVIGKTIEWLSQPETVNRLGEILDTNNRLFELLGEAGQHFGSVLLTLAEEAGPFLESMGQLVLDFAKWIDDVVNSEEGRSELRQFFENVGETIGKVYDLMKLVGGTLYDIYEMARPYGQDLLDDIKGIAERFDDWVNSAEGGKVLNDFLKNGRDFLSEILGLIEDVVYEFIRFGAENNMAGLVKVIREDLFPAVMRLVDAFGGGSDGGGLIFFLKVVAVTVDGVAATFSLFAAIVSGIGALFDGDWSGARASFADFMDSVEGMVRTTFGRAIPEQFYTTHQAFSDSVRGIEDDGRESLSELEERLYGAARVSGTTTGQVALDYEHMANKVGTSTARYRDDVDAKTKDAKAKAEENTRQARIAVIEQTELLQAENAAQLEKYRRTVDKETNEAKKASNRNITDTVLDAIRLLGPFPSAFATAAMKAKEAMQNPGVSWWDIGASIVTGLMQGVVAWIPNFLTSVWNLGVDVVNTIRRALDQRSPSRKMIDVGKNVGEGLALGIESMDGRVKRASAGLAKTVTDAFGVPELDVDVSQKVVPTVGTVGAQAIHGGARNVNYITVHAAPNVPTEKQISNILTYQEALYG